MKSIDAKSVIIGALLSAVVLLSIGLANQVLQEVRIFGVDKDAFESWGCDQDHQID